ncbi:hypothetical protein [Methylobacter sp.]|uniref:hypothetical protein n=1 Tax=Methylobacter sp. TaxID=2051955 RepID=UPI003DA2DFB5
MMILTHQKTGPKDAAKIINVYCAHFLDEPQPSYKKIVFADGDGSTRLDAENVAYSVVATTSLEALMLKILKTLL